MSDSGRKGKARGAKTNRSVAVLQLNLGTLKEQTMLACPGMSPSDGYKCIRVGYCAVLRQRDLGGCSCGHLLFQRYFQSRKPSCDPGSLGKTRISRPWSGSRHYERCFANADENKFLIPINLSCCIGGGKNGSDAQVENILFFFGIQ